MPIGHFKDENVRVRSCCLVSYIMLPGILAYVLIGNFSSTPVFADNRSAALEMARAVPRANCTDPSLCSGTSITKSQFRDCGISNKRRKTKLQNSSFTSCKLDGHLITDTFNGTPSTAASPGSLTDVLANLAPYTNRSVSRSLRAFLFAVGKQSASDGLTGGLLIGGASADESGAGAILASDGLANWIRLYPSKNYNPQEFNIYGSAGQGIATAKPGTGTLTRIDGTAFDPGWTGRLFYWNRTKYRVASVSGETLTVTTPSGGPVSFAASITDRYRYLRTTGSGRLNVSGLNVTRQSGDPFIPFIVGTDFLLRINGIAYDVASFTDKDHITLATPVKTQNNVEFDYSLNINDQIASLRLQMTTGYDEENLTIAARATGEYEVRAGIAGGGQYYPIRFYNGDNSGVPKLAMEISPEVTTIGGAYGTGVFTVFSGAGANRIEMVPAMQGHYPAFMARGSDPAVGMGWDVQGSSAFTWTAEKLNILYAQLNGLGFVLPNDFTPASSVATCIKGQTASDSNYLYKCVGTNQWKRAALTSWP